MLFKLDENLPPSLRSVFQEHGHDVMTVREQGLRGRDDPSIATVCKAEGRAIVTLDLDFSDIRHYPPREYHGIVVLRLHRESRQAVLAVCRRFLSLVGIERLERSLWIVDEHTVRIHGDDA